MAKKQKPPDPSAPSDPTESGAPTGVPADVAGNTGDSAGSRGGGRPKGAKNIDRPESILMPACCPKCKSTKRAAFRDGPVTTNTATVEIHGQTFTRQIWRNTRCLACGQNYRVIEYRND